MPPAPSASARAAREALAKERRAGERRSQVLSLVVWWPSCDLSRTAAAAPDRPRGPAPASSGHAGPPLPFPSPAGRPTPRGAAARRAAEQLLLMIGTSTEKATG